MRVVLQAIKSGWMSYLFHNKNLISKLLSPIWLLITSKDKVNALNDNYLENKRLILTLSSNFECL